MGGVVINKPPVTILGASSVAVSGAADTNENTLATIVIPAGAMGLNGILRVYGLYTITNSANNKILRFRLGATAFYGITYTTQATVIQTRLIGNRGVANSQVAYGSTSEFPQTTGAVATAAIDTSAATTVTITGQKASAGEVITLESYLVELILP